MVGYENKDGGQAVAKMWKNKTGTSLTDGSNRTFASSVFVKGNDVYVSGIWT